MSKRLIVIVLLVLVLLIGIGGVYFSTNARSDDQSIESRTLRAITRDIPAFSHEGKPVFQIHSVSSFDNKWHIVTIKSLREVENFVPVKVLVLDLGKPSNELKIVLGPAAYFSDHDHDHETEEKLTAYNIPESVVAELRK